MKLTFKQYLSEAKYYRDDERVECPECNGKGRERVATQNGPDDWDIDWEPCRECGGQKTISRRQNAGWKNEFAKDDY